LKIEKLGNLEDNESVFHYPVCKEKYNSSLEALQCPEIHGYPKNKFQVGDKVICQQGLSKGIFGTITNITFAKPGNINRKSHAPLYLIKTEGINNKNDNNNSEIPLPKFTTAQEGEIDPYT